MATGSAEKTRERPILFSGEMVRAILAGKKTQTRRVVKSFKCVTPADGVERDCVMDVDGLPSRLDLGCDSLCPYGQPGDRLWVREAWYRPTTFWLPRGNWKRGGHAVVGYPGAPESRTVEIDREMYRKITAMKPGLRPALFMPRWASRLRLEITGVRNERLQDITEAEAIAEGVNGDYEWAGEARCDSKGDLVINQFWSLWDSINAKRGYGWESNPWVWVIEFRRV